MKTKFYFSLLTFLVLALLRTYSQDLIVFEDTKSETYLVSYDRTPTGNSVITNPMLETLARGNKKSVYATEFTFTYDVFSRIVKKAPKTYEVFVSVKNPRLQGDVFYRGFDAAQPLLPSEANFTVYLFDQQGGMARKQAFLSTPLTEYPAPMAVMQVSDTNDGTANHRVEVRDKLFFYRNINTQQLSERTEFIDAYYAAGDLVDQASVDLGTIRPNDYDGIQEQNQRLTQIEQLIAGIGQQDFPGLLPLTQDNDFIQLMPRLQNVRDKAGLLRTRMDGTFAQLPILFVERGRDFLAARNEPAAIADFNKSLELNPDFAPAHLELAKIDFQRGNFAPVEQAVRKILGPLAPDPATRSETVVLARNLYAHYLTKGNGRNATQEFSSALEEYDAALRICRDIAEVTCGNDLMTGMSQAKKGIYARHLDKAKSELDAKRFEEALIAVEQAKAFRVANSQEISDPTRENQLFDFIQGGRYRKSVADGKELVKMKKHRQALQMFDNAFAMETKYNIVRDPAVPELRKQSAKPLILGMIEEGLFHVRSNNLTRARESGEAVQQWMGRYGLKQNGEIIQKFQELKSKIFSQECTNAQNEYKGVLAEANALIQKQSFIEAEIKLKAAREVIQANAACGIDESETRTNLEQIADAAEYQRKMLEIDGKVNRNLTSQALQDLGAADQFFRSNNIDRFGLKHPTVFEYVDGTGSKDLHLAGAQYFAGKEQPETSLELLRKLAGWGFPKGRMKFVQRDVGAQMAQIEHALNPSGNPKSVVEKHYRGNKGLKHFRKGFLKQWKAL